MWHGKREKASSNCSHFWDEGSVWGWQFALHCAFRWRLGKAACFTVCSIFFSRKMQNWKNTPPVHSKGCKSVLAPSPVTGFGIAGTQEKGQFQSELRRCLSCSLAVLCSGFWLFWPQPFGVSFCERLLSVVSCTLHVLGVQGQEGPS